MSQNFHQKVISTAAQLVRLPLAKVIFALSIRPFPNWGWVLASGLISIALAAYLFGNLTTASEILLGVLLGIQLLVEGAAITYLAWRVREGVA
mgnify:CR=1 FL=1